MPYDPDEWRREQNAFHVKQDEQKRLSAVRSRTSEIVTDGARTHDHSRVDWELGIPPAGPSQGRGTPTAGEQFRQHSRLLVVRLDSLLEGMLPTDLTNQWRRQIALLDIEQTDESLAIAISLRDSYRQAKKRFTPSHSDIPWAMWFEDKVSIIEVEIQWLIDILTHVRATARSR